MQPCSECSTEYPEDILMPFNKVGEPTRYVCGICALKIMNSVPGTRPREFFLSPGMEYCRQQAIIITESRKS